MTLGDTNTAKKREISLRLYPEIREAFARLKLMNVNYEVNAVLAGPAGVHPAVIEALRRETTAQTVVGDLTSVRLYKPVAAALQHIEITNLNYMVNLLLAEKLGVDKALIEARKRVEK